MMWFDGDDYSLCSAVSLSHPKSASKIRKSIFVWLFKSTPGILSHLHWILPNLGSFTNVILPIVHLSLCLTIEAYIFVKYMTQVHMLTTIQYLLHWFIRGIDFWLPILADFEIHEAKFLLFDFQKLTVCDKWIKKNWWIVYVGFCNLYFYYRTYGN